MNDTKRSFILHLDTLAVLDELDDKQAGKLFKAIKAYQLRGLILNNQDVDAGFEGLMEDFVTRIAFAPFKAQFDRDTEEYTRVKENNQEKGRLGNLKRWNKELYDKVVSGELTLEEAEEIARAKKPSGGDKKIGGAKKSSLNGSDSDSDSDKEEKKYIKKENQDFSSLWQEWENYMKEVHSFRHNDYSRQKSQEKLKELGKNDLAAMQKIVNNSIGNNYKDFYHKETKQEEKKEMGRVARDGTRITMF